MLAELSGQETAAPSQTLELRGSPDSEAVMVSATKTSADRQPAAAAAARPLSLSANSLLLLLFACVLPQLLSASGGDQQHSDASE